MPDQTTIIRRQGRIGRITLNRPKALNALDLPMIHAITAALRAWHDDPAVHAVVIDAVGDRAFCAGGDIRWLRDLSIAGDHAAIEAFFVDEYALNLAIARYPKPYVALIDGICMGGGIGVSIHGSIRVATEAARFAMPETAIGFFPDVGATFFLPRLRGAFGMHLGLTGARIGGADAAYAGLATHLVPRDRIGSLADAMAEDGVAVLAGAAIPPPPGELCALEHQVACFGQDSLGAIIQALDGLDTEWSRATLATLRAMSPTALSWSFEIVRRGAGRTLEHCLQAELALTRHASCHPDFLEGVRAMVIDKDRTPRWSPPRLQDVSADSIAALFG